MFSFFSTLKAKRFLFAGLVLFLLAGFLGGCSSDVKDEENTKGLPNGLVGKWVDPTWGDFYEITRSGGTETLKYDSGYGSPSQGTIEFVSNFDANTGVIIVNYTTASDPGKPFGAVYYRNLTVSTVQMSDAYNGDYSSPNTATREEAIAKFTRGKTGDFIALWGGPYVKEAN